MSSLRFTHAITALTYLFWLETAAAMEPFKHEWGTVSSMMIMHGKYKYLDENIPQKDIEFVANHYATVTTGTGCRANGSAPAPTIEESVQAVAHRIKAVNPTVQVGMYWRVTEALELAACR